MTISTPRSPRYVRPLTSMRPVDPSQGKPVSSGLARSTAANFASTPAASTSRGVSGTAVNPSPSVINPLRTGLARTGMPSIPAASRNLGGPAQATALRAANPDGIDVNSYNGSIYGKAPITPALAPSLGGDARTNFGRLATPRTDINADGGPVVKATPPVPQKPQSEQNNPLSGDTHTPGNGDDTLAAATGTALPVAPVNAGAALGVVQRGTGTPKGQDAMPAPLTGGKGLYARKFQNPKSASLYDQFTRNLFAGASASP